MPEVDPASGRQLSEPERRVQALETDNASLKDQLAKVKERLEELTKSQEPEDGSWEAWERGSQASQ